MKTLLAIDQGTTSSRAIIYDETLRVIASAQREFSQFYPAPGLVEHDANEIWDSVQATIREALQKAQLSPAQLHGIGITNQRETVVLWDRHTGEPLHRAIVWQDRRTADFLEELRERGHEGMIRKRTGLLLDPYFSASKIRWLLREIPDGFERASRGEIAAGTIDSWLVHRLTAGRSHITDVSNASRTMLMNLQTATWDKKLLKLFSVPAGMLPEIVASCGTLATTNATVFGAAVPIAGILGDQQAALFGQHCIRPGQLKCTYGTGCFLLAHMGQKPRTSNHRLLTTVAWKLENSPIQYAMEGSVFMGGATIQWLRDGLQCIASAPDVQNLASRVEDSGGVVFVPAFTGLGAPHWDSSATGTLLGLSRGTSAAHIARAALEGIASQVVDVVEAMAADGGKAIRTLRVDGGASACDLLMQIQADFLGVEVERPANIESTALGAAMLAGLGTGVWPHLESLAGIRKTERTFSPEISNKKRTAKRKEWRRAVRHASGWSSPKNEKHSTKKQKAEK